MADVTDNILMNNGHGKIDGRILKVINGKTYLCKYPDMSGVVPSEAQLKQRAKFREAYTSAGTSNCVGRSKITPEKTVFPDNPQSGPIKKSDIRRARIMALFQTRSVVTNGICCRENRVSKPTSYRDLQSLVQQGKIKTSGKKGPDAKYILAIQKESGAKPEAT